MINRSLFSAPQPTVQQISLSTVPAQVNARHLHKNLKLFAEEHIAFIQQAFNEAPVKSITFKDPNTQLQFRVIQLDDGNLYAIYHNHGNKKHKVLGSGCYGKVKLAQALTSGEWYALKFSSKPLQPKKPTDKNYGAYYRREIENLKTMRKLVTETEETVLKKRIVQDTPKTQNNLKTQNNPKTQDYLKARYVMAMPFEKGLPLDKFLKQKNPPFPALLIIMFNMCLAVSECHRKGLWHGDIKPDNFIIDPVTYQVTLIDFGLSLHKSKKDQYTGWGAPAFLAYEVHKLNPHRNKNLTEKSEINALGIAFAVMIGADIEANYLGALTVNIKKNVWFRIASDNELPEETKNLFPDDAVRQAFLAYLSRMTHQDADERPMLIDVLRYLKELLPMLDYDEAVTHVGMVNLQELICIQSSGQALSPQLIQHLKTMDYVCFITNNKYLPPDSVKNMHLTLTQLGITVQDCIYYVEHSSHLVLITQAKETIVKHSSPLPQLHYYLTEGKTLSDEQLKKLETVDIVAIGNKQAAMDVKQNKIKAGSLKQASL